MYCLLTKQGGRYSCHSEITLRSMKYFIVDFKSLTVFLFHIYSYDSFRFTNIFYFGAINVHRSCGLHQQHCDSLTFFTAPVFFRLCFFQTINVLQIFCVPIYYVCYYQLMVHQGIPVAIILLKEAGFVWSCLQYLSSKWFIQSKWRGPGCHDLRF